MARDLIRLSGFEPDVDIKIEYIGLRPGEKLFEELITEGEGIIPTNHEKILMIKGADCNFDTLNGKIDQLGRLATPKGEYLAYSGVEQGKPAEEILPGVLQAALDGLPIPRRMRWGDEDFEFVRPVHWLVALLDDRVVPMELFGVAADRLTRGHRFHSPGWRTREEGGARCTGRAGIRDSRPGVEARHGA